MENTKPKAFGNHSQNCFPERFKVDPQGTLVLASNWWREYVQEFPSDRRLDGEMPHKVT
jgi:hypothetical protein